MALNCCDASEFDNSTDIISNSEMSDDICAINAIENQTLEVSNTLKDSNLDVVSNTSFDVVGDYFKVKLLDNEKKSISNAKITFSVNGVSYKDTTDKNGIASLQIRLKDGSYKITTKFDGDAKYNPCSRTTKIIMNNTIVVKEGLSGSEIQKIIDNAKTNNMILFEGTTYENVNLVINKRLTLLSKVNTVLKAGSTNPTILISGKNSSSTVINGFDIQGNGNGIEIKNSDYVTIKNNDIKTKFEGIVTSNVNYLNITKNNIVGNGKNGIVLCLANSSHISNNKITHNGLNGIVLTKSSKSYIYDNTISYNGLNGIYMADKLNGVKYGEGPQNLYISKNTINYNKNNGIFVENAGDNININMNTIQHNSENGISLTTIGTNTIQSNEISHSIVGIKFNDEYIKPKSQEISYNVIYRNSHLAAEAKDTYYYDYGDPLSIGDNWYTDNKLICPKIKTNNLRFEVTQIGENLFQATFYDSKGNIASLLPDRELTYKTNDGQTVSVTLTGGSGVFTVKNANDGDVIKATVDSSHRYNTYDSNTQNTADPVNGATPSYSYPQIEYDSLYDDVGKGEGDSDGNGAGSSGNTHMGNGTSNQEHSDFTGNSSTSQNMDPSNSPSGKVNDVSQSMDSQATASQASASQSSSGESVGGSGFQSQSVVKQIIIDEDEIVKITGISFIILLIILAIGLYYREDIKEMKSKL